VPEKKQYQMQVFEEYSEKNYQPIRLAFVHDK